MNIAFLAHQNNVAPPTTGAGLTADQSAALSQIPEILRELAEIRERLGAPLPVPLPPNSASLCRVYGYLALPGGQVAADVEVAFYLVNPGPIQGERILSGRTVTAVSDANGYIEADLDRNDTLTPAGSQWRADKPGVLPSKLFTLDTPSFNLQSLFMP